MTKIAASEWFSDVGDKVLLDVRTPGEFLHGHIPGAKNLPLFSDEERAVVGTLYKQVSQEKAFLKGLEFAGAKLAWYVTEAVKLAPSKKVVVHCWRGGKRSSSMGTLLQAAGFDVQVMEGGYKAYRNYILQQFFDKKGNFIVIGGKTGSGKTEILQNLQKLGEQIIDLEGLANHKGSAFGALGEAPQPTVEQFENLLFDSFNQLDLKKRVWVENESKSIGRVFIPDGFWEQIKSSVLINVEVPFDTRVQRLIAEYGHFQKEELESSIYKIEKRMGGQHVKAAVEALHNDDLSTATAIALNYYDKTYLNATAKGNFRHIFELPVQATGCHLIAKQLIEFAHDNKL